MDVNGLPVGRCQYNAQGSVGFPSPLEEVGVAASSRRTVIQPLAAVWAAGIPVI